MGPEFLQSSA